MTFSVIPVPHTVPYLVTHRNNCPLSMCAVVVRRSTAAFTQLGTGTDRMCFIGNGLQIPLPNRYKVDSPQTLFHRSECELLDIGGR